MTKGVLPTKRQVIAELRHLIHEERNLMKYRVLKTVSLRTIRCLEMALLMVKEHGFPKRKKK